PAGERRASAGNRSNPAPAPSSPGRRRAGRPPGRRRAGTCVASRSTSVQGRDSPTTASMPPGSPAGRRIARFSRESVRVVAIPETGATSRDGAMRQTFWLAALVLFGRGSVGDGQAPTGPSLPELAKLKEHV